MPTITFHKRDLDHLLGRSLTLAQLDQVWSLVKGEVKEYDEESGEFRFELNDTNRPDLWCVEGIARQIKYSLDPKPPAYSFYDGEQKSVATLIVDPTLEGIRPYVGGVIVRGLRIDEVTLINLIQTQEKLSEGFGRRRELVSIGLYRLNEISFPVSYTTTDPQSTRFIPLGYDKEMSLEEIIKSHPKGLAYGRLVSSSPIYPILVDSRGKVLSFPPIINSRQVGEVQVGDPDLFVEVTGTDLRMVMLTVNIMATNLFDRGGQIAPVEVRFPYSTDLGRKVHNPFRLARSWSVHTETFDRIIGEKVSTDRIVSELGRYGYQAKARGRMVVASVPPYRDDLMHAVDVVEDFAIVRGYSSFTPEMPRDFGVGALSYGEAFSDRLRGLLIGMGYQEILSNVLSSRHEVLDLMGLESRDLVEVENVMSENFSALRSWIVPSLMKVEAASSKAFYPHRIFEVGEAATIDPHDRETTLTLLKLAALISHSMASFSELQSDLDSLFYYLGQPYQLEPTTHPSFMEGRVGHVVLSSKAIGLIGEVHPKILENWKVAMPCTVFELDLGEFLR